MQHGTSQSDCFALLSKPVDGGEVSVDTSGVGWEIAAAAAKQNYKQHKESILNLLMVYLTSSTAVD